MTLRVTIEIVPFGDENEKRTIDVFNISNLGVRPHVNGHTYVIERNDYKNYTDETPRVVHQRDDGHLPLVLTALGKYR